MSVQNIRRSNAESHPSRSELNYFPWGVRFDPSSHCYGILGVQFPTVRKLHIAGLKFREFDGSTRLTIRSTSGSNTIY